MQASFTQSYMATGDGWERDVSGGFHIFGGAIAAHGIQTRKSDMIGHSENGIEGDAVLWMDGILEKVEAGYDVVTLYIREENGRKMRLRCLGYIGCS